MRNHATPSTSTPSSTISGLAFGALNAFAGAWLEGSPFDDYLIPSLVLFVVVGGSLLAAAIAVFAGSRFARRAAVGAGVVVLGWLAVETLIIGYVSWMQPVTAVGGLLIVGLALLYPHGTPRRAAS